MNIIVTNAENGFVVNVKESDDLSYYYVALDVGDVCAIIETVLTNPDPIDLGHLAYEAVPRDR
jgi:hypothetical protein